MMLLYDGNLQLIGPVNHPVRISVERKYNELSTATLILPAEDPQTADIDVPATFARIWDGERDLGYYRFSSIQKDEHAPEGTITYELQSAACTLVDKLLNGWHEIGGTDYNTRSVLEYLLNQQVERRWELGRCDFEDYYQYNFQDVTLLEGIMSLGEVLLDDFQFIFDSTVTPWTMHLVKAPQMAAKSLVYRRNMTAISRSVDGRVVTRLYGRGYGEGDNQLTIAGVNDGRDYLEADSATIARYGVREGVHVDTRQTDPNTLMAHMQRVLDAGCRPSVSYESDAIDLYMYTGESWDNIEPGDKVLVLDEVLGMPVGVRATSVRKDDIENNPGGVKYTLDNNRADTAEELNEIRDKIGVHELYSQGATNMYSMQISDNAEPAHPLEMRFYVPGNVLRINSCLIKWDIQRFRTHITLTKSGGGGGRTSAEGGGATVTIPQRTIAAPITSGTPLSDGSPMTNTSTPRDTDGSGMSQTGGASGNTGSNEVFSTGNADGSGGSHSHLVVAHRHPLNSHTHNMTHVHPMSHYHLVNVAVTIPAMTFDLSPHTHNYTIPEHTHEMEYGIYEGARAQSVSLVVDGEEVPEDAYSDDRELDIASYLRKNADGKVTRSAWHTVKLVPDALSRLTANLFFQVFIQSRGAGDY